MCSKSSSSSTANMDWDINDSNIPKVRERIIENYTNTIIFRFTKVIYKKEKKKALAHKCSSLKKKKTFG